MRYLIYTETFPSRVAADVRQTGIGRYCADLASGLSALGHHVTVATNAGIGLEPAREPFPVQILGPVPASRLELVRRATQLRRLIGAERADIVLVGDLLAHRTVGSLGGAVGAPYCPIFYGTELAVWLAGLKRPLGPLRRAWIGWYVRRSQASICISRYAQSLLHQLASRQRRECIVYPCVSELCLTLPERPDVTAEIRHRLTGAPQRSLLLLTVARISERKNQLGVLHALARLHASSEFRFHYLVLGNLDSERHRPYLQQLRSYADSHGLGESLTVVENTTDEEKVRYLDACDTFIMLSQTVGSSVEGFGISVIEAASRGKPVVVSDQGGMPETVLDGVTGFSVPPADSARVADVLATLARHPGRRAAMGSAGRDFTLRHFTPRVSAGLLHGQLFEQLAGSLAGRRNPISASASKDL
jgi:glycosyltransferase involved in cell wall biosynthesis